MYFPKDNDKLNIFDDIAEIEYRDKIIKLQYETEPPFGDFIYSIKICSLYQSDIDLPFWTYGRNIRFRNKYIIFDAVKKHSTDCFTIIMDLVGEKYLCLTDWYDNCELMGNAFHLSNSFINGAFEIAFENVETQDWVSFANE